MASRKEEKARLRAEREAREREAARQAQRRRSLGYVAAVVIAVAAVGAIAAVVLAGGGGGGGSGGDDHAGPGQGGSADFPEGSVPPVRETDLRKAARAAGCKLEDPENEGSEHVSEPVRYKANPPTSGNHNPEPADDGAYTEAPPAERLVHSLEHGRVVIQYRPSVPDRVKGDLKALFDEDPAQVVLAPNDTDMPAEVAATAWDHSLTCPKMSPQVFDAIRAFRDRWRNRGPEYVP